MHFGCDILITLNQAATKESDKMALSKEDLQAVKELMNEQLKPINDRLNIMEIKQDRTIKKLDDLRLDVAVAERDIRRDIFELKDEMGTVIEVLRMNEMLPR